MRLLLFIHSLSFGGAERIATTLANYWAEKGWHITIVTVAGREHDFYDIHPNIERIALCLDAEGANLLAGLRNNYSRLRVLRKVLIKSRPDVGLGFTTTASIGLALASRGLNMGVIGSERTFPPMYPLGGVWEWLRRRTYGYLDAVVAQTEECAIWLKNNTGARFVPVIPNAVFYPIPSFPPKVKPTVLREHSHNLIAVGRLVPLKGFDRLLAAFAQLAPDFPDWHLTILGEGDYRSFLERQAVEQGLQNRVSFPGNVGNIGEWYTAADLYVMTSLFEGFPNTLCEAMASGLPVVSVDCDTGPRDIFRDQIEGLLVPQNNPELLVEAMATLMSDTVLREQYATNAVGIRERLSLEKIVGLWEKLFNEVKRY